MPERSVIGQLAKTAGCDWLLKAELFRSIPDFILT